MLGNMVSKYFINTNEFDIFLTYRNNKQNYPHENFYKFDALTDDLEKLIKDINPCLLYTSPSPRDPKTSRMPSSA